MSHPILNVTGLTMDFGGIRALNQLDLDVNSGEIAALIGPNGAGKTTFFNCVTGIYQPTKGDVFLHRPDTGKQISLLGLKPNKVCEQGLARTFQNIRLFSQMTVLENVMIGRHCRTKAFILGALIRDRRTLKEEKEIIEKSHEILEKIGAGGMGEVYRAEDTKLGRLVAIKVLPEEFVGDKERMARFEREARTLAALNHPNIAAIYGLEEHEGSRFLVLELVEGDTLEDRRQRR